MAHNILNSAGSKMCVAIIGSSHVARLKDFCVGSDSAHIDDGLNLGDVDVAWFGRRGGMIDTVWNRDLKRIIAFAPESIVIILGGNDLDNANGARVAGDRTASGLIALAQILRKWTPANDVYICGILPRLKPRSVDPSDYAQVVQSCNDTLQLLLNGSDLSQQAYPGVHYWRIRRLMYSRKKNVFQRDGTHLNNLGNIWLYYNIQHAVRFALRARQ